MQKYWLECYTRINNESSILFVDELYTMKDKDFNKIVKANKKRYKSDDGMYAVWGDGDQTLIQQFTEREIDCEKYQYHILTDRWVETLKAVKASDDFLEIEWGPNVIKKGKYDESLYGSEGMPTVTVKELCDLFKLDPAQCPFDGIYYSVDSKYKDAIQKKIKHKLDFDKNYYCIINTAKMLNCAVWENWLPI